MSLGGIYRSCGEGKAMDRADSDQLELFKRRLEQRLGLWERWRLRYNCSKPWLRDALQALWYVLLACPSSGGGYELTFGKP